MGVMKLQVASRSGRVIATIDIDENVRRSRSGGFAQYCNILCSVALHTKVIALHTLSDIGRGVVRLLIFSWDQQCKRVDGPAKAAQACGLPIIQPYAVCLTEACWQGLPAARHECQHTSAS